jgi:flagellar M-ring protein FliF
LRDGGQLAPGNVTAIQHLVSSAVDGLSAKDVSVMDAQGNLLSRPKSALEHSEASDELIEYRHKLERDLLAKANATLEPLLGAGRYRIGLSVDCDFSTGEQSDEVYDPERSVMLTSQKTEEANGGAATAGVPGTGSNLPRSSARTSAGGASVTRRTENVTYQSSKTVRRVTLPQGSIRRISASVLLDQTSRWENQNGRMERILTPPAPESVRAIRELLSAAVGLVPARGDQLVIESLPFESTLLAPPPSIRQQAPTTAAPNPPPAPGLTLPVMDWRMWAGGAGILILATLLLYVARSRRKAKKGRLQVHQSGLPAGGTAAAIGSSDNAAVPAPDAPVTRALAQAQEKVTQTARIETLVEELRRNIDEDPALAASVLRSWIEEEVDA